MKFKTTILPLMASVVVAFTASWPLLAAQTHEDAGVNQEVHHRYQASSASGIVDESTAKQMLQKYLDKLAIYFAVKDIKEKGGAIFKPELQDQVTKQIVEYLGNRYDKLLHGKPLGNFASSSFENVTRGTAENPDGASPLVTHENGYVYAADTTGIAPLRKEVYSEQQPQVAPQTSEAIHVSPKLVAELTKTFGSDWQETLWGWSMNLIANNGPMRFDDFTDAYRKHFAGPNQDYALYVLGSVVLNGDRLIQRAQTDAETGGGPGTWVVDIAPLNQYISPEQQQANMKNTWDRQSKEEEQRINSRWAQFRRERLEGSEEHPGLSPIGPLDFDDAVLFGGREAAEE